MKVGFLKHSSGHGVAYLGGIELVLSRLNSVNLESLLDIGCGDGLFPRSLGDTRISI